MNLHETTPVTDKRVLIPALVVAGICAIALIVEPGAATQAAMDAMNALTSNFGWLYMSVGVASLGFAMWLAFGPYGHVLLGPRGEKPEYSTYHWVAMMFTAGIGAGLMIWAFAEPIYYLDAPPFGIEPYSAKAMEWAHMYPMFHWGITPWSIYAVTAVPIAYLLYVRKENFLRVSSACDGVLPKKHREPFKLVIDVFIVLGIIGGTSTSLGLGAPLVSVLVANILGVENSVWIKSFVLLTWALLFAASVYRGLKKGIQILADINMALAVLMVIFIIVIGPGLLILNLTVNSFGLMLNNFLTMSLWTDPVVKSGFPEAWTIFYWAWWISFAAFVGLFVGRISRGRTIKQIILGVIFWGSLGTWVFLAVGGGYSIHLQAEQIMPLSDILREQGLSEMVAQIIGAMPYSKVVLVLFAILCVIFFATSIDSAAYVIASVCSKDLRNDQEPPVWSRLTWAILLGAMTIGLVITEQVEVTKSVTILSSFALIPIMIMMCVSLTRWLKKDFDHHTRERIMVIPEKDL